MSMNKIECTFKKNQWCINIKLSKSMFFKCSSVKSNAKQKYFE